MFQHFVMPCSLLFRASGVLCTVGMATCCRAPLAVAVLACNPNCSPTSVPSHHTNAVWSCRYLCNLTGALWEGNLLPSICSLPQCFPVPRNCSMDLQAFFALCKVHIRRATYCKASLAVAASACNLAAACSGVSFCRAIAASASCRDW